MTESRAATGRIRNWNRTFAAGRETDAEPAELQRVAERILKLVEIEHAGYECTAAAQALSIELDAQLALTFGRNFDEYRLHENLDAWDVEFVDYLPQRLPVLRRGADHQCVGCGIGGNVHGISEIDALAG